MSISSIGKTVGRVVDAAIDLAAAAEEVWDHFTDAREGKLATKVRDEVRERRAERYPPIGEKGGNSKSSGS